MVKEIKRWWPLFVLPTALSFLFGFVIPFAQGLYLSFCEFITGGEPAHSTEMLALNIFNTFYSRSGIKWMGIGQAKAVIFCILVVVIALVQLRATQSKEVEQ